MSPRYIVAFGIILPLVCFGVDLIGLRVIQAAPLGIWILAALGMIALALSLRPAGVALHSILVGSIASAGLGAALIGVILAPFAVFGTISGILFLPDPSLGITLVGLGLFALVPLLTSFIFLRRAQDLFRQEQSVRAGWVIIGAGIVILPSVFTQIAEWRWIQHRLDGILQTDPRQVEQSLRELADYRFRFSRGEDWICGSISGLPLDDQGVRRELTRIYGSDPVEACRRRMSD